MQEYLATYSLKYIQESEVFGLDVPRERLRENRFSTDSDEMAKRLADEYRTTFAREVGLEEGRATLTRLICIREISLPVKERALTETPQSTKD